MSLLWIGGEGQGDLPQWAYVYLVTVLKVESDAASRMQCVQQADFLGDTPVILVRIFDPGRAGEVADVTDFATLDRHPELIMYEGYQEKATGRVSLARRSQ